MITPTYALNFTAGVLDPRIAFTRALNTATCVNSSGFIAIVNANLPRFDYDPATLASKGLLIEEQRTNLMLLSEEFNNGTRWILGANTVTADTTVSPDGTVNADTYTATSTGTGSFARQQATVSATTAYTVSCFFKKGTAEFAVISPFDGANGNRYWFNLNTGVVGSTALIGSGFTNPSARIEGYGNGWYRCSVTFTTLSLTTFNFFASFADADASLTLTSGRTGFIWGAQLEAGAFATSYIPTTTTALTRNADVATITGSNFTSFWNATQGGATVQATPSTVSGIRPLVQYDDGTVNEIIALRGNTTNPELYIVDGGTPQAQLDAGTIAANTAYSLTGWWATNDCRARKDSGAEVTDATATIPTVTQARIGSDGTNYLNGTIATINYYAAFSSQIYTRRKNKVFASLF